MYVLISAGIRNYRSLWSTDAMGLYVTFGRLDDGRLYVFGGKYIELRTHGHGICKHGDQNATDEY